MTKTIIEKETDDYIIQSKKGKYRGNHFVERSIECKKCGLRSYIKEDIEKGKCSNCD